MFEVVVVTDLDRLSGVAKTQAYEGFERLSYGGVAVVKRVPPSATEITPEIFENCSAVVVRPTDRLQISRELFARSKPTVGIFSVSVGKGHLKKFVGHPKFEIFDTSPYSNARGVAAFNIMLASALLSRLPINANNVDLKNFECTTEQTNLVDKNWLVLGSGDQTARLLEFSHRLGISNFYIWNDRMDPEHFNSCFRYLAVTAGSSLKINAEQMQAELSLGADPASLHARAVNFYGTNDFARYAHDADIVSLQMRYQAEDEPGRAANAGYLNRKLIRLLTKRPVLINTARGELINENDIVEGLKDGLLQGVAVDVLEENVERDSAHPNSPLWSHRLTDDGKKQNIIITPHISGSADNDTVLMWGETLKKLEGLMREKVSSGG
jgi:phosphoglycerate dehydrogenase-like enzyme